MRTVYSAIFNNLFIKISSLLLALVTWSYVLTQLYSQLPDLYEGSQAVVAITDKNVIVKKVPVHISLLGAPDKNHRVLIDKIKIYPSECVISGPPDKIENISFVTTEPISLDGIARSISKNVKLKYIEGLDLDKEQSFHVTVPVVRLRMK